MDWSHDGDKEEPREATRISLSVSLMNHCPNCDAWGGVFGDPANLLSSANRLGGAVSLLGNSDVLTDLFAEAGFTTETCTACQSRGRA